LFFSWFVVLVNACIRYLVDCLPVLLFSDSLKYLLISVIFFRCKSSFIADTSLLPDVKKTLNLLKSDINSLVISIELSLKKSFDEPEFM